MIPYGHITHPCSVCVCVYTMCVYVCVYLCWGMSLSLSCCLQRFSETYSLDTSLSVSLSDSLSLCLSLHVSLSLLLLQPLRALLRQKEALVCAGPSHLHMFLQIHTVTLQVQATWVKRTNLQVCLRTFLMNGPAKRCASVSSSRCLSYLSLPKLLWCLYYVCVFVFVLSCLVFLSCCACWSRACLVFLFVLSYSLCIVCMWAWTDWLAHCVLPWNLIGHRYLMSE